uniref:ATP synthase complex subunit 8 n=1 Tax=Notocochlis gualtieriana TaxID=2671062 RepID=A0A6G6D667_9CAEN|nr:ATP synthase F0 subunit 8 [Notocochlis gualtieriana]QIE12000.1 ATP synthase F0 subunit 8 [Notocochlis gualtieriana]
MPQLSPLNWIFLFLLFWVAILVMSVLIWWSKKIYFSTSTSKVSSVKENKWNW